MIVTVSVKHFGLLSLSKILFFRSIQLMEQITKSQTIPFYIKYISFIPTDKINDVLCIKVRQK